MKQRNYVLTASAAVLGLLTIASPSTAQQALRNSTVKVTATVRPNPPQVGDNTLDLLAVDASGSPKSGLKFTTSVAMTSMDMGTTHPSVKDLGNGHYRAVVHFSMDGPWRVTLLTASQKAAFDFNPGAKPAWTSPALTFTVPATAASAKSPAAMPNMPNMPSPSMPASPHVTAQAPESGSGYGMSDMQPIRMPQLQEEGTYVVTGREDWKARTGFGKNAPMVGMMNKMMIGGSGMEGMKMAPMKMDFGDENFNGDIQSGDTGTSTESQSTTSAGLKIEAVIATPKSGDNALSIKVADAAGEPVTGANITASVAMTSMDMGTAHPSVTEIGDGRYTSTVDFGMVGPWRVTLLVAPKGGAPQTASFDFDAK